MQKQLWPLPFSRAGEPYSQGQKISMKIPSQGKSLHMI
jgi:hypothetical protein